MDSLDLLRRLMLGKLYKVCENDPNGVSEDRLRAQFQEIKGDHCVGNCSFDDFVKVCRLKSHVPTCTNLETDEKCLEDSLGKKSDTASVLSMREYYNKKNPSVEENSDEIICEACQDSEDENGNLPQKMSCGHYNHISCLIRFAQAMSKNTASCPSCRKEFTLVEVPVPVRSVEQQISDRLDQIEFNARQMGRNPFGEDEDNEGFEGFEEILEMIRDPSQHDELVEMLEVLDEQGREDILEYARLNQEDRLVLHDLLQRANVTLDSLIQDYLDYKAQMRQVRNLTGEQRNIATQKFLRIIRKLSSNPVITDRNFADMWNVANNYYGTFWQYTIYSFNEQYEILLGLLSGDYSDTQVIARVNCALQTLQYLFYQTAYQRRLLNDTTVLEIKEPVLIIIGNSDTNVNVIATVVKLLAKFELITEPINVRNNFSDDQTDAIRITNILRNAYNEIQSMTPYDRGIFMNFRINISV